MHRLSLRHLCLFICLLLSLPIPAWSQDTTTPGALNAVAANSGLVSNASLEQNAAIQNLFAGMARSIGNHDPNALRLMGVVNFPTQYTVLTATSRLTHIALAPSGPAGPGGALVRQVFKVSGATAQGAVPVVLDQGVQEVWLDHNADGSFRLTDKRWAAPENAVTALAEAAQEELEATSQPKEDGTKPDPNNGILDLVAQRRGGRWIALRRSRWAGVVFDAARLKQLSQVPPPTASLQETAIDANDAKDNASQDSSAADVKSSVAVWLRAEMSRFPGMKAVTAHFLLQRTADGWIGLNAVWDPSTAFDPDIERTAASWRDQILGPSYWQPEAHRAFGDALFRAGLYNEAADEMQKAEALVPGIVPTTRLQLAEDKRADDPQTVNVQQLESEAKVGLASDHPTKVLEALKQSYATQPTALSALRIGLELSKLADDAHASAWLTTAEQMIQQGDLNNARPGDVAWAHILYDHLKERRDMAPLKPRNLLRSALFTLRCSLNDADALTVLASLEAAQHRVYADFNIPMSSTEVVLWHTQAQFQKYTSRFSGQATSEFVAALTLTKLIGTRSGPVVLGEEINVFVDQRANTFSTVKHEYGHVAVRHMSRGRSVPVWFNEGIATFVEGGYENYVPRVQRASRAGILLSMDEMKEWGVDGERAFLAYSQANSIIDYIVKTYGAKAVLEILRQIGDDVPPEQAFQKVLGVSTQELWNHWVAEGIN